VGGHVRGELAETAAALLRLSLTDSTVVIKAFIEDGYFHLEELQGRATCNPLQVNSLAQRIDRAESLLVTKAKQKAGLLARREVSR